MNESRSQVEVIVSGYVVTSAAQDQDELAEVAYQIRSDIGAALASLGTSSIHGEVILRMDGIEAVSNDDTDV